MPTYSPVVKRPKGAHLPKVKHSTKSKHPKVEQSPPTEGWGVRSKSDYVKYDLFLTKGQQNKLGKALKNKTKLSLRIEPLKSSSTNTNKAAATRRTTLLVTQTQINKYNKNKPFILKLSKKNVEAMAKEAKVGGALPALIPLLIPAAAAVLSAAASAAPGVINAIKRSPKG